MVIPYTEIVDMTTKAEEDQVHLAIDVDDYVVNIFTASTQYAVFLPSNHLGYVNHFVDRTEFYKQLVALKAKCLSEDPVESGYIWYRACACY